MARDGRLGDIGQGDQQSDDGTFARELRRTYHDRIAEVRERSLEMLRCAIVCTAAASEILSSPPGSEPASPNCGRGDMRSLAAAVDAEVVSLLALESPMARDLRVILASRDVTQIGLLCVGLSDPLPPRMERAASALGPEMRKLLGRIATDTESLLRETEGAWASLDPTLASSVEWSALQVRALQTEFLTSLVGLVGVPMEPAIDLSMVGRALERLVDHSVEIAERVEFAVHGTMTPPAEL